MVLPETVAVPTVVPPVVQLVGGESGEVGPNTVKVIVPVASLVCPARVALIALAAIAVPAVSLPGADTVVMVVIRAGLPVVCTAPASQAAPVALASPRNLGVWWHGLLLR